MAEIDWLAFSHDVAVRLDEKGLSYAAAMEKWPETNKAFWSRAANGKPLSAGNYLLACKLLWLKPDRYLRRAKLRRVTMKTIVKQAVTVGAARETREQT
ncbi:MAG: hypothetical protein AB7O88_23715 [Reyranellaceae bacterium]